MSEKKKAIVVGVGAEVGVGCLGGFLVGREAGKPAGA